MGLMDKITGRAKKAGGELTDSPSMKRQGTNEERKGEAKEQAAVAQDEADRKAQEAANRERAS